MIWTRTAIAAAAAAAVGVAACSAGSDDGATSTSQIEPSRGEGQVTATGALRLDQPWRPTIHYAPPYGWMNDPNGMSYIDGRYHLYFQYNPLDVDFGDIGWGHAVSDDLTGWETWPVAIEPEPDQLIFSGSLVHDVRGTSPLCEPAQEPSCLVAVYTTNRQTPDGAIQTQDLAVSDRAGIEFTKFDGNPVLDLGSADFRDPKVFWHDETERWIMVVVLPIDRQVVVFGSADLVGWEELSRFGPLGAIDGIWECPDLFPVPVIGAGADGPSEKWVMKVDLNPGHIAGGSGGQYFLGDFDGTTFTPDENDAPLPRWVDWGQDFYCATTFHQGEDDQRRPLWLGWMNNWSYATELPTFPWRGSMTIPRRIELTTGTDGRLALTQRVADEILAGTADAIELDELDERDNVPERGDGMALPTSFLLQVDPPEAAVATIILADTDGNVLAEVVLDAAADSVRIIRPEATNAGPNGFAGATPDAPLGLGEVSVLVDRASIEVFADEGRTAITSLILPIAEIGDVTIDGLDAGDVRITSLDS